VIPKAAVEAAAKAHSAATYELAWEALPEWAREAERNTAKTYLEAAAPHMRAQFAMESEQQRMIAEYERNAK